MPSCPATDSRAATRRAPAQSSTASTRRKLLSERSGIHERLLLALETIEVPDCGCKLSMTPVCLILCRHGCRQRRRIGLCECKKRDLPACQLEHPGGCELRRQGKPCACKLTRMAECLSPGCVRRQRGRLCNCPRWPGQPCEHVISFAARMRFFAAALLLESMTSAGGDPDSGWCLLLHTLYPKRYRGPIKWGAAANLIDRQTRVARMAIRRAARLKLYHPHDIRYLDEDLRERRQTRNAATFWGLLCGKEVHRG